MSDWEEVEEGSEVERSPRMTAILTKVLAGIYLAAGLPFLLFIPQSLSRANSIDWTSAFDVFISLMSFVVFPLIVISGIGLLTKRPWARPLAVVGPLLATLGGGALLVETPEIGAVFVWLFIAIPTVVIGYFVSRPSVAEYFAGEPRPDENFLRLVLIAFVVVVVLAGVVGLIVFEVPRIGEDLRLAGWERDCEGGNMNSCGMLALHRLRKGSSTAEMKQGVDGLGQVCEYDYVLACRRHAYAHGYIDRDILRGNSEMVLNEVTAKNGKACLAGDARSCFMARFVSLGEGDPREAEVLLEAARKACEPGEEWACIAAESHRTMAIDALSDEARISNCRAGVTMSCTQALANKIDGAVEVVQEHCETFPDSQSCSVLERFVEGDELIRLQRSNCNEGRLDACGPAADSLPEDREHREAVIAVYRAMARAAPEFGDVRHDVGFWSVEAPDDEGLDEACEAGVAEACFGVGLRESEPGRGEVVPPLDDDLVAAYERSFGKACDLGMNAGCLAMAERLRNRPFGEEIDVAGSNSYLAKACERGNRTSCWLVDIREDLRTGDFDLYEKMLVDACRAEITRGGERSPCRELAFVWSYNEGRTPWLLSERLANAYVRPICEDGDKWACTWSGWHRPETNDRPTDSSALPWHVEDYSALERACKKEHLWACSQMLEFVKSGHPAVSAGDAAELERRVCKVLPETDGCSRGE